MRSIIKSFVLVLCFLASNSLFAQKISIQGTLKDINGKAVADNTSLPVTFKIYSAVSGGTAVWTETANVAVSGGVYSHYLGSSIPLEAGDFTGVRYLGVTVNGSELTPRTELSYSPYALSVASAQSIANNTGTAIFDADGDLTINKGFNMENAKKISAKTSTGTLEEFLSPRWSDNVMYLNIGSAGFNLRNNTLNESRMFVNSDGSVGLGTTSPLNRLDVEGGISIGSTYSGTNTAPANGAIIEGDVAIGTSATVNSAKLTINDNDPKIQLVDNGSATSRAFIQQTNAHLTIGLNPENTTGNFYIQTNGANRVTVDENGKVGIGTTSPDAPLHINLPSQNFTTGSLNRAYFSQDNGSALFSDYNSSGNIAIKANGWVFAQDGGFVSTSDKRIKDIIGVTDNAKDLETINKIEITDYLYKDKLLNTTASQKKVIAQQIVDVYPIAIKKDKGIIPNVYELASKVNQNADETEISIAKNHDFETGDKIKLIVKDNGVKLVVVKDILDKNTFIINEKIEGEVFVYGKEVDDLLNVDYDALSMLNISATQELYKKIIALEDENQKLKTENKSLNDKQVNLETRLDKVEGFMKSIKASTSSVD